jgi:hypothetical protein
VQALVESTTRGDRDSPLLWTARSQRDLVTPYGVFDLDRNEAWVSVGISHDTGEFAVQSVRTWWQERAGRDTHTRHRSSLLRTAEAATAIASGTGNSRCNLWSTNSVPNHRLSLAAGDEQVEQDRT